jgi:hypothetical protein
MHKKKGGKGQGGINGLSLIGPPVIFFGLPERKLRAAGKKDVTKGVRRELVELPHSLSLSKRR